MCRPGPGCQYNPNHWSPFTLGFMRDNAVELVLRYGHKGLQMDATFGTNNMKFPLTTLLVVDDHKNGIPVAFFFASRETHELLAAFLDAVTAKVSLHLYELGSLEAFICTSLIWQPPSLNIRVQFVKVQKKQPGWQPPFILCDASDAEIKAVQLVYGPHIRRSFCATGMCSDHGRRIWFTR